VHSAPGQRLWTIAVAGAATCFYTVFIARTAFRIGDRVAFTLFDDAMISMRYARNLAEGRGLVFNPGQEAVEGYSNFLWTLVMAVVHLAPMGDERTSLVVMLIGAGLLICTALLAAAVAGRVLPDCGWAPPAAAACTAFYYPLVFWTLRGMEVGIAAVLLVGAALLALRIESSWRRSDLAMLGALSVAAVLTRADLVVPLAPVLAYAAWRAPRPKLRLTVLVLAAAPLVAIGLHTLFRLAYYGYPLPNTYYLKVGGIDLDTRVRRGALALASAELYHLWLPTAGAVLWLAVRDRRWLLLLGPFLGGSAYSVVVGGDVWESLVFANRYLTPTVPLLLIATLAGFRFLVNSAPRSLRILTAVALVALAAVAVAPISLTRIQTPDQSGLTTTLPAVVLAAVVLVAARRFRVGVVGVLAVLAITAVDGRALHTWVTENAPYAGADANSARLGVVVRGSTPPPTSIAVVTAGSLPYFAHRTAIDQLGKNDHVIAMRPPRAPFLPGHDKWDLAYSINHLRPELIAQFWPGTSVIAEIESFGYHKLPTLQLVRNDAAGIDEDALVDYTRTGRIPDATLARARAEAHRVTG
jgi:hypothetical protein